MFRQKIYRWHRMASLIIALPVMLWALSGIMHPLMTTIKPRVASQSLPAHPADSNALLTGLQEALKKNDIAQFYNFRLVHIDTNWFYQVQTRPGTIPVYLSTHNGKLLRKGDELYAQYLAKQFLQPTAPSKKRVQYASLAIDPKTLATPPLENIEQTHDCCDAATACVLYDSTGTLVDSVSMITAFNKEYKYVNRLLPVYRVDFDRADGIRVYVETTQDRYAYAVDNKRAFFDRLFGLFHTWEWLNAAGDLKYVLMVLITGLGFLTTIMGLCIFFTTKTKKSNHPLVKARRRHRYVSVVASLFTLCFTFSGGFHALTKMIPEEKLKERIDQQVPTADILPDIQQLQQVFPGKQLVNFSIAKMDSSLYWRVIILSPASGSTSIEYVRATDHQLLPDGDEQYARYLAAAFSKHPAKEIVQAQKITKFSEEYGFINKRLPVWKIDYAANNNERYYIETSSGSIAAHITDNDLYEGYSFALLHKHHFMDWGGKTARDISTLFWAGMQVLMIVVGLILFFRAYRKRKRT